jgi:hypothetical protein
VKKIKISKGISKYIAIMISALILVNTAVMIGRYRKENTIKAISLSKEDMEIAAQISNITGIKAEDISKIKAKGYSWNEVLAQCKNNKTSSSDQLSSTMLSSSMSDEYIKKLNAEGFSNDEINAAQLIVERVQLQLKELTDNSDSITSQPANEIDPQSISGDQVANNSNNKLIDSNIGTNSDEESYRELQEKFDFQKAIYLMLKLKKDFGSFELVLDEYLYSIQVGIDLEQYIKDKKKYEEEKAGKSAGIDKAKLLTLAKLEEKILEKIQLGNQKYNSRTIATSDSNNKNVNVSNSATNSDKSLQSPLPDTSNNGVKNTADSIMQEIKDINNRSLNMDGR